METHKCSQCEFTSSWASSIRRHFNRKHSVKTPVLAGKSIPKTEKSIPKTEKSIPKTEKNLNSNQCDICEKIFTRHYNLLCHKKKCKGKINKLECKYCNEIFTLPHNKYRHQKICKIKETDNLTIIENQTNNIINNNITNNDNRQIINNNITLQIRNFGDENKDYITNTFIVQCYNNGYYGLVELIEKIYFNIEHPENHNVRIGSFRNKYLEIHKDANWIPQSINETLNRIINSTAACIIVNIDDKDKEIEKIMEIQNLDSKKEKLLKESINSKLIARKKLKCL